MGNKMTQITREEAVMLYLSQDNVDVARVDASGETFAWLSDLRLDILSDDDDKIFYVRFDYDVSEDKR